MFHFVYKTTCLITGKYYIGLHSTKKIDDGYLGSGLLIRRSIKKHGVKQHVREILGKHLTRSEASLHEATLVSWNLIQTDRLCLNRAPGGEGGDMLSNHPNRVHIYSQCSRKGPANGMFGRNHREDSKALISQHRTGIPAWNNGIARTVNESVKISAGTKVGMREPKAWARFMTAIAESAKRNTGKITIWKAGKKKIIWPADYTTELKQLGWVTSKAESLTS